MTVGITQLGDEEIILVAVEPEHARFGLPLVLAGIQQLLAIGPMTPSTPGADLLLSRIVTRTAEVR